MDPSFIIFCSSILPYLQLHQTAAGFCVDGCPPSLSFFSPPGLVSPVNTGNADWCDEEAVCPVESVGGSSSGNRAGGLLVVRWCAQSQEVVFTRLSFVHAWTLGRTSDILAWLKPKIFFFFISLKNNLTSCKIIETHLDACALQLVIYL